MLANLAEEGYLTATVDPPRLYTITDDGRAHLQQNQAVADAVLNRLRALGERVSRWRRALGMADRLKDADADATDGLLEVLARAANDRQRR